jgi:hypothetical protein
MSEMMENGSSGGARPLPFSESHDEFRELCALSTTDALSAEEKERLNRHLIGCTECREEVAQYKALIAAEVPAAVIRGTYEGSLESDPDWSLEEAQAQLLARLENEDRAAEQESPTPVPSPSFGAPGSSESTVPRLDAMWGHMWLQCAAALLLVLALGYSAYRTGRERGIRSEQIAAKTAAPARSLPSETPDGTISVQLERAEAGVRDGKVQLAALDARLRTQTAEVASLERQNKQAQTDLSSALAKQASLEQARDDLARRMTVVQTSLDQARQRFADVSAENAGDTVRVIALRRQIDDLNSTLALRNQDLSRTQALLDHDRDIRDLMGSRNLYIAEVYDVAKNGQTKKPFGRVFYTKGRSLIFYAYDLDQQAGVRDSSSFQAWGSRGRDREDAISLGIFYQDSAAKKCWVLKAENPKILSGIDAVFVTVEPRGGSTHPSSRPLLYAYLHIEPNHP